MENCWKGWCKIAPTSGRSYPVQLEMLIPLATSSMREMSIVTRRKSQVARLAMIKFWEIIRLHELGYNQSEIAQSGAVASSTVQDYIRRAEDKGSDVLMMRFLTGAREFSSPLRFKTQKLLYSGSYSNKVHVHYSKLLTGRVSQMHAYLIGSRTAIVAKSYSSYLPTPLSHR
jgi:hypothetical protein